MSNNSCDIIFISAVIPWNQRLSISVSFIVDDRFVCLTMAHTEWQSLVLNFKNKHFYSIMCIDCSKVQLMLENLNWKFPIFLWSGKPNNVVWKFSNCSIHIFTTHFYNSYIFTYRNIRGNSFLAWYIPGETFGWLVEDFISDIGFFIHIILTHS